MKVKTTILLLALLIAVMGQSRLFAGTTGKIAGKITDAETKEPLIGANVVVQGYTMGGASDLDGNYAILNVSPGVYTVVVTYMGYRQMQFEKVPVSTDLTTTINASMQSTALELGSTVVVIAEKKLVLKDMTSSLSTMTAEEIESLPAQQVQQILRLNAGVIESDGRLHIRGGRAGEVAYWVDGISATDVFDGRIGVTVENSAVQELQVISGTFNAEYGQAMSGIVNIITKEGGKDYSGQIKVYGGDYVSNDKSFSMYDKLVTSSDPSSGLTRVVSSERDYPLKGLNPIFNGEMSLGGPVPFSGDKLTFFANGRYFYDEGYYYGRNWFQPNGTPGDSSSVAMNPNKTSSFLGKLNYQLSPSLRFSYNFFWNQSDRDRNYFRSGGGSPDYSFNPTGTGGFSFNTHDYKYVPNGLPQTHGKGATHTLMLNHILSPAAFYELRASRYSSKSDQYVFDDPLASVKWLASVNANTDLGIAAETFDFTTPEGQSKLQDIIARGGTFSYVPDPDGPQGYLDSQTINAPASYSFLNKGMDVTRSHRSTSYWVGKLDFTSQLNSTNQFKFGSEARLHELELHTYQLVPATDASGQVINPFVPAIPDVGSVYRNDYDRKPKEFSAYVQDKLEFNKIILNVGLRYDYFDPNSVVPADPTDPNIYAPFKDEHIYKDLNGDAVIQSEEQVASNKYTPDERRAFMQKEISAKTSLSPRLGIAFPITDQGVIHFSYGHFYQVPEFQFLYANPDFKITSGGGTSLIGNSDLKPQKTVMYEIGLEQQLAENLGVDMTLFYRDVRDWVGTSPTIQTAKTGTAYSKFVNKDYSNVRGITLKVEKRMADHYSVRADYTFQSAEGTYSSPTDEYNATLSNRSPALALVPMGWDQRHTLNAQFIYNLSNWTFSLIGRYWSGRPYTPSFPVSESVGASAVSGLTTNSARRPVLRNLDMTINRAFRIGTGLRLDCFVNVYNLLDLRDATSVYGDTGSPDYTTTIDPSKIPYNSARVSTVEDVVLQPTWYTAPRQVHVGFALGF